MLEHSGKSGNDAIPGIISRSELIDGKRLAELMLRDSVGVQAKTTDTLYDLDEDIFEEL